MIGTTPRYISIHAFCHRNVALTRYAQCGTFPAAGEGRSIVQECVRCAHLETRRGDSVPAVSTRFYDPGAGGGAAIFAFFCLGMGRMAWSCGATVLLASIGSCLAATLESIHWSSSNTKWVDPVHPELNCCCSVIFNNNGWCEQIRKRNEVFPVQ